MVDVVANNEEEITIENQFLDALCFLYAPENEFEGVKKEVFGENETGFYYKIKDKIVRESESSRGVTYVFDENCPEEYLFESGGYLLAKQKELKEDNDYVPFKRVFHSGSDTTRESNLKRWGDRVIKGLNITRSELRQKLSQEVPSHIHNKIYSVLGKF